MNREPRVYVRQEDGALKPCGLPDWLAERVAIYQMLTRECGLSPDEARYLIGPDVAALDYRADREAPDR